MQLKKIRGHEIVSMITLLEWIYNPGTGSVLEYKDKEIDAVNTYIKPLQARMFSLV